MSGLSLKARGWRFSPWKLLQARPLVLYFHRSQKEIETKRSSWLLSFTPYGTYQACWNLSDSPVECVGISIYGRESAPFLKSAFLCMSYQRKEIESGKLVRRVAPLFTHICLVFKFILIFICVLRNKCDGIFFLWVAGSFMTTLQTAICWALQRTLDLHLCTYRLIKYY